MIILAGLMLCGNVLRADIIYSNFGNSWSYIDGAGVNVADGTKDYSVASAFTPGANYDLTSIEFVAATNSPSDGNSVTVGIYADNSGIPGGTALESLTLTGPLHHFDGSLAPVLTVTSVANPELLGGTRYWLVMDGPPSETLFWYNNSTSTSGFVETDGTAGNWANLFPTETNGVFQVDGRQVTGGSTIPEPGAWMLMAGGLAVLLLRRRGFVVGR
jgi:hypothetical protein